jgi:PAS domain S-box-containing protein
MSSNQITSNHQAIQHTEPRAETAWVFKFIPRLSPEERKNIETYLNITRKYKDEINELALEDLNDHPIWGPIIKQMPKEMMDARNDLSYNLQIGAVVRDEWEAYLTDLVQQGVQYAQMGILFKDWYEIVAQVRKYLFPILHKEFPNQPNRIIDTLSGMDTFIDLGMTVIGESYIEEKRKITEKQKIEILEQKQLTQRTRSLIEASLDPFITTDIKGKITDVNEAMVKATGLSRERLLSSNFAEHFSEPLQAFKGFELVFEEKGYVSNFPLQLRHKDGSVRDVLYNASIYRDENGEALGVFAAARDITEQKKASMRLEQLNHEQKETIELVGEQNKRLINFAHIVSHNLRSHSGNIGMLLNLYQEEENPEDKAALIAHALQASNRLSETITNLNDVVSVQLNINEQRSKINLYQAIEKSLEIVAPDLKSIEAKVSIDVPKDILIEYVASYLDSILLNMITNCIKYQHPDKKLEVRFHLNTSLNHTILEISDNGLGIDLDKHGNKIFGMYNTFHEHKESRGLGLFITKNQVEAMGGKIEVESEVNKGTTFKIYIS